MKILYFSSVPYSWMKQRPQFVAEHLLKKYETDYICCIPVGKPIESETQKALLNERSMYVLPFALKSGIIRFVNKVWLTAKVNFKKYDLIILTHPIQLSYIPKNKKVIYECMDYMEGFYEGKAKKGIVKLEKSLIKRANHIICSANSLKDVLIRKGAKDNKISIIKNAVEKEWTETECEKISLKHPNLVYAGTVSKWFDIDILIKLCNARPEKTVYIVGKSDLEINNCPKNLIFTGKVPHAEVKKYIKSADIYYCRLEKQKL